MTGYVKQDVSRQHTGSHIKLLCHTLSPVFSILNSLTQPIIGQLDVDILGDRSIDDKVMYRIESLDTDKRISCQSIKVHFRSMDILDVLLSVVQQTKSLELWDFSYAPELPGHIIRKLCKVVTEEIQLVSSANQGIRQRYTDQLTEEGFRGNLKMQ